jgi:hypothetical protein
MKVAPFKGDPQDYKRWTKDIKVILQVKGWDKFLKQENKADEAKNSSAAAAATKEASAPLTMEDKEAFLVLYQSCKGVAKDTIQGIEVHEGPMAVWTALHEAFGQASEMSKLQAKENLVKLSLHSHTSGLVSCFYENLRSEALDAGLEVDSLEV